jgi:hypothetical protein
MHADFQTLLSVRDGTPVAAKVGQHVADCALCRRELARLTTLKNELRQLPQFAPPARAWAAIHEELVRSSTRRQRSSWLPLSAAAALLVAVTLALLWATHRDRGGQLADSSIPRGDDDSAAMIGSLVTRSQQLEEILQRLPRRPMVERAATSAAIDELQARIQVLDLLLSSVAKSDPDPDRAQRLWNARVQLLNSLVSVRYAEAARDGHGSVNSPTSGVI